MYADRIDYPSHIKSRYSQAYFIEFNSENQGLCLGLNIDHEVPIHARPHADTSRTKSAVFEFVLHAHISWQMPKFQPKT